MASKPAGYGIETGKHAASLNGGRPGVLHGNRTYLLQDDDGQIIEAHSISAGLDYPGIGPEHAWLHDIGRVQYVSATDKEALAAFQLCSRIEGIIPALEPAHALAHVSTHRRQAAEGPSHRHEHVRPRRQGHLHRRRARWGPSCEPASRARAADSGRIAERFAALKADGRGGLVTFVTAGDPDPETSLAILEGPAGGRRRSDRARHAVHRSRWPTGRRSRPPACARSRPA